MCRKNAMLLRKIPFLIIIVLGILKIVKHGLSWKSRT